MSFATWLKERHGPLPNWGYLVAGSVGVIALWYLYTHRSTASAQQSTSTGVPSTTGFDSGGGGGFTLPGQTTPTTTPTTPNPDVPAQAPIGVVPITTPINPPNSVQPVIPPIAQAPRGTSPGPNWIQVPSWAHPNPRDVITDPYGDQWIQLAASQQNVLNGSNGGTGYGAVGVSKEAQAWVNTMRLNGIDDVVPMSYLDPSIPFGGAGDAVLSVPGSPGWEYEQGLAKAFQNALAGGATPQQAGAQIAGGYLNTGTLPDYVNHPEYQQMLYSLPPSAGGLAGLATPGLNGSPIYGGSVQQPQQVAPAMPMISGGQPIGGFSMSSPNTAQAPYPPPAPPPIPQAPEQTSNTFNYGQQGFNLGGMPIGLSIG